MVTWTFLDGSTRETEDCWVCGLRDSKGQRPIVGTVPVGTHGEALHMAMQALHGNPKYDSHIVDTSGKRLLTFL